MSRASRWAGRLRAGLAVGVFGASSFCCVDVLGIAGTDGSQELCDLLAGCFSDGRLDGCYERLEGNLASASPLSKEQFLASYQSASCLSSCTTARDCLDHPAICEAPGNACGTSEECCKFTEGTALCVEGTCCGDLGGSCATDENCCNGVACIEVSGTGESTCGGIVCAVENDSCQRDSDCCTGACLGNDDGNGTCGPICRLGGASCTENKACCSNTCGPDGTCVEALTCAGLGGDCGNQPGDLACCPEDGSLCYAGQCQVGCFDDEVDCQSSDQCCSGLCDPLSFECSTGVACIPTEQDCLINNVGECCDPEARCESSLCLICDDKGTCGRDPLVAGGKIGETCNACAIAVCAQDPSCCCVGWDPTCAALAASLNCASDGTIN